MSGFAPAWLRLREPLDAASRAATLDTTVAALLAPRRLPGTVRHAVESYAEPFLPVVDLGSGTGANLRYTAPVLGGAQDWLLVEHDPLLLAAQDDCMQAWAGSAGAQVLAGVAADGQRVIRGRQFECRLRSISLDMATQLDQLAIPDGALLCASALLDLVSERWLRALARRAVDAAALVWFTLSYDGRIECDPVEPEDREVCELFNAHQLTNKGFGPALGPEAARLAERLFAEEGYYTCSGASDWRIGPAQRELQHALVSGWFEAAGQVAGRTPALHDWLARRQAHIEAGRSWLRVGHVDMAACPR